LHPLVVAAAAQAEYPRLRAVGRPVPTAAARLWGTAKAAVPQPAAIREAASRPQEEVAAEASHPFAVAAVVWRARRSAGPAVSAAQAAALPPEEPEARDAARAVVAAPHEAAAVAVEAPREGAAAVVGAPREEVGAAAVAPHAGVAVVPHAEEEEAAQAAAALLRAAPGAVAGLPSAAAWAFRRDQVLPWPAPSPAARSAHATAKLSTASP
jgi:hypothetical protein